MENHDGLICAYLLDGKGGGQEIDWKEIEEWTPEKGLLWIHLNRKSSISETWLRNQSGLDPLAIEALLAEETRPRYSTLSDALLVILRGVNLNEGSDPEDMVSIRLWVETNRIISLRLPKLMAIHDIREDLIENRGPKTSGEFLTKLASRLIERMRPVLVALEETIDDYEEEILDSHSYLSKRKFGELRRRTIGLRRYLIPQRDMLSRLQMDTTLLLDPIQRSQLLEIAERITRYTEDLDTIRERAAVIQDELSSHLAEQLNRTMYILSLVATVFLPLGLLTGLLGINVGGIPGTESDWAFAIVCVMLLVIAIGQYWIYRKLRLL